MQKPSNYDDIKPQIEKEPITTGGHYLRILGADVRLTKTGKEQVVVVFDFEQKDAQSGYFKKQFEADDRTDKKWPYTGTSYINTESYTFNGKERNPLGEFCRYIEWSNKGFIVNWDLPDKAFGAQFKGKLIGGVFGMVENEWDGNIFMRAELRWFCTYDNVPNAKTPNTKFLNNGGSASSSRGGASTQPSLSPAQRPQETTSAQYSDEPDIPF